MSGLQVQRHTTITPSFKRSSSRTDSASSNSTGKCDEILKQCLFPPSDKDFNTSNTQISLSVPVDKSVISVEQVRQADGIKSQGSNQTLFSSHLSSESIEQTNLNSPEKIVSKPLRTVGFLPKGHCRKISEPGSTDIFTKPSNSNDYEILVNTYFSGLKTVDNY